MKRLKTFTSGVIMGLSVLLGCAASNASAETLWLPSIFSEGMVQRDMPSGLGLCLTRKA